MSTTPARVEFFHCVMLLAFTGCRAAEITQLDTADVKQVEGIWCIDLCEGERKSLKNRVSIRTVPIHSQLLPIFLPFFQQQTGRKLFPLSQAEGSPLVSRWFRDLLRRIKIKRPSVSLP
jgi:integrase